jgi:hypothetical protein
MSTVKSKKLQVGTDARATNNFTIYQPTSPDGTLRVGVGNADSPTEVGRFDSNGLNKLGTATGDAPSYSARAWVAFTGNVNPIVIRASGNVSSITDSSTGQYKVNFATAMPDADFCTQFMAQPTVTNAGADTFAVNPTTTTVDIRHFEANVYRDSSYSCVVVFR